MSEQEGNKRSINVYSGRDGTLTYNGRIYHVFGGTKLPRIIQQLVRCCPEITDEDLQVLVTSQMDYDLELLKGFPKQEQVVVNESKYGWYVVLLATVASLLCVGSPDIIDGVIHWLMNN